MDEELWVEIPHHPDYWVSDRGNVLSAKSGRYLATSINQQGQVKVNLMRDHAVITKAVGPMVARAFLPPKIRPDFNSVIHKDGDKTNNDVRNLEWRPRHIALKYHSQFSSDVYRRQLPPVMDLETREVYPSVQEAAKRFGLLVHDILVSSYARTFVWPTFQRFQLIDD